MPKKPIKNFSLHVRSSLPFPPICYLPQYMESDANDFTGNHGTNYRDYLKKLIMVMGAAFNPGMTGKYTVLIAALYVPFPLLFLLPLFLLLLIFSSSSPFFPVSNH